MLHFTPLFPQNQSSCHDNSLLPCCCPSVHLQLRLLPSAFCPTGVFYSDGQTWALPGHCWSKLSLYGQKKKKNQSQTWCSVSGGYSLRTGEHIPGWNMINPNTRWSRWRGLWKYSSPGREVSWFHCLLQHTWVDESACIISFPKGFHSDTSAHAFTAFTFRKRPKAAWTCLYRTEKAAWKCEDKLKGAPAGFISGFLTSHILQSNTSTSTLCWLHFAFCCF